jgi:hypothetical protein
MVGNAFPKPIKILKLNLNFFAKKDIPYARLGRKYELGVTALAAKKTN